MVNLAVEFSDKKVTPFGGMNETVCRCIGHSRECSRNFHCHKVAPTELMILSKSLKVSGLVFGGVRRAISMLIGYVMTRYCKISLVLKVCLHKVPISRFFNKFSLAKNTEIFPELQAWSLSQVNIERITLDLDSTVITRAGAQQGSTKGLKRAQLTSSVDCICITDQNGCKRLAPIW